MLNLGGGRPLATPAVVDAVSGETRWALRVSDDGPTAAVASDGVVAFNTESCTLFVVDAVRGRPLWSRWLGDPLMSQPAIGDGKVFMAFPSPQGHRLVAFTLRTGEEQWRVPLAADIISAPVLHGDSVYSATFNGMLYRHRAADGGLAWREDYRATSAPWLYGNEVFVSHREDPVAAPRPRGFLAMSMLTWVLFAQTEAVGRLSGASGSSMQQGGNGYRARSAPWLNTEVQRRSRYNTENAASDTAVGFSTAPAAARADEAAANIGQGTVRGMWEYQGSRPCVVDGRLFLTQGDQLVAMEPASGRGVGRHPPRGGGEGRGGAFDAASIPASGTRPRREFSAPSRRPPSHLAGARRLTLGRRCGPQSRMGNTPTPPLHWICTLVDEAADVLRHEVQQHLGRPDLLQQGRDRLKPEARPPGRVDEEEREGVASGAHEPARVVDAVFERARHDLDLRFWEAAAKPPEHLRATLVARHEERAHGEGAPSSSELLPHRQQALQRSEG